MVSRSRFAPVSILNVGVLHPRVADFEEKGPSSWPIFTPYAERLFLLRGLADDQAYLDEAMNDASALSQEERRRRLTQLVDFTEHLFFDRFSTVDEIEEYAEDCSIPQIMCSGALQKYVRDKVVKDR